MEVTCDGNALPFILMGVLAGWPCTAGGLARCVHEEINKRQDSLIHREDPEAPVILPGCILQLRHVPCIQIQSLSAAQQG